MSLGGTNMREGNELLTGGAPTVHVALVRWLQRLLSEVGRSGVRGMVDDVVVEGHYCCGSFRMSRTS